MGGVVGRACGPRHALCPNRALMGHHGQDGHRPLVMGGVMKLGKALATGVAEERPQIHEEDPNSNSTLRGDQGAEGARRGPGRPMRLRLPEERPTEPPTGYKIAHPVLSQDGTRAGFTGVSLGGALPYGVLADASCVYGLRHRAPNRRCDCGFHCVHDRDGGRGPAVHGRAPYGRAARSPRARPLPPLRARLPLRPAAGAHGHRRPLRAAARSPRLWPTPAGADRGGGRWPPPARAACAAVRPSRSPGSPGWPGRGCGWWRGTARG